MQRRFNTLLSGLLLCLLLNFVFSNTVFIHTHQVADGRLVTHSHPFIPSGTGHTHSGNTLDTVASFNIAASAFKISENISLLEYRRCSKVLKFNLEESIIRAKERIICLRGPPIAA